MANFINKPLNLTTAGTVFFQRGLSLKGKPLFFYIARNVEAGVDWDSLLYHIVSLLHPLLEVSKIDQTGR
jgi:hypothetical protein